MTDYITFNITNGKVIRIKCADTSCSAEYTREDIRKFGSQEIFEKYLKFKENIDVNINPNMKWCTRPDCNRFVVKGKNNRANCECGFSMCFKCGQAWHTGKCDANVDSEFKEWAANNGNVGNCPKCKARIEKNDGCNHMTCGSCKYEYCWICGAKYSGGHYSEMNIFGCPGQHFSNRTKLTNFLINLAIFIFLPLIFVLGPPIALAGACISESFRDYGCCSCGDICLLKCLAGLIFVPIVFAIGFIGSAFLVAIFLVPVMLFQFFRLFKLAFNRCACCLK